VRIAVVLAAILLSGVTAGRAWAVRYVALGDSYSSGTGTHTYYESSCERSVYSYPYLVHKANPSWTFVHAACSGATTRDVISVQSASLTSGTDRVTYTVGGNDADFSSVIAECAQPWWSSDCDGAIDRAQAFISGVLPEQLDAVNAEIESKSPAARVVALSYPRLFMGEDCDAGTFFSPQEETRLNQTADMLRDRIRAAARRAGANFVFRNAIRPFVGHAVCDPVEWVNGLSSPVGESYHPNRRGHRRGYARLVRGALG
jgi:hypothetical protein